VESEQVWEQLKALGCTTAQGYYLSRPIPAPALQTWLLQRRRARDTVRAAQAPVEVPDAAASSRPGPILVQQY
jgi:predicted signal transduction protein with EAL and GGDEF domain